MAGKKKQMKTSRLLALPAHLFRHVLSFLSFEDVSYIRIVCRRFNGVGRRILNQEAARIFDEIGKCKRRLKYELMPRKPEARVVNFQWDRWVYLDVAEIRLNELTKAYAQHSDGKPCCFVSGKVLDAAARFVKLETHNKYGEYYSDEKFKKFYDLEQKLEESCEEAKSSYDCYVLNKLFDSSYDDENGYKRRPKTVKRRKVGMKVGAKMKELRLRFRVLSKNKKRIRRMNRAMESRVDDLEKRTKGLIVVGEEPEWEEYFPDRGSDFSTRGSRFSNRDSGYSLYQQEDYRRCFDNADNYYKWWAPESDYGVGYFGNGYY